MRKIKKESMTEKSLYFSINPHNNEDTFYSSLLSMEKTIFKHFYIYAW